MSVSLPKGAEIPRAKHSLTLSSGAVFTASVVTQGIGVVASFFLYHVIGASSSGRDIVGTVQLFLLIGSSINGVGDLRLGTAFTYFLARGKPPTDNLSAYLLVRMLMVGLAGVVIFVIAPLSLGGAPIASGGANLTSLGIFLFLPLLWSFSSVYNQLFIGLGNSVRAQYPFLLETTARLPVIVLVSFYDPTIEGITIAYVLGAVVSTLFCLPAVVGRLRRFRWAEVVGLFRFAWPLMGSLVLGYIVTNLIPLVINAGLGVGQLTYFLAANGWRILVLSLPAAVTTPLFPYLAGLHQRREFDGIRRGIWQALRYSAMLIVPGVVALVTYRTVFLNVFANAAYAQAGSLPLAILVVGAVPLALSQIMQSGINAIGRQRLELYITTAQVAVLFTAVGVLMPPWGILPRSEGLIAGSVAVLLSSIAAVTLNTYFMEVLIRVHVQPRSIASIVFSAAGSFWVISEFNRFLPHGRYYQLAAAVALGFAVYFVVLALIGELTREDVRQIGASIGLPARLHERLARLCWREATPGIGPVDLSRAPGLWQPVLPETFTGTHELPKVESVGTDESEEPPGPRPP